MKKILTIAIILHCLSCLGQKITLDEWNKDEKDDIRLRPKFGYARKTDIQKKIDQEFIQSILKLDTTARKGSNHLIRIGFDYLSRDLKTAMYRFNQAYLMDSTNTDIYWGFGSVYLSLSDYDRAEIQYREGLKLDSNNTRLLTNLGTNLLAKYYALYPSDPDEALKNLDQAIPILKKSYKLDSANQVTSLKLSVCYWNKNNCEEAWKYYDACKLSGGQAITEDYTRAIEKKCKRKKR